MKRILLLLLIFSSFLASSQNTRFTGTVIDEDNKMLIYNAIVTIEGTTFAKTTNASGEFSFTENIPSGEHMVSISKTGYELKFLLINVITGNPIDENPIGLVLTKKERKGRNKTEKSLATEVKKREKERDNKLKNAKNEREKNDKQLAKEMKRLQKEDKKANKNIIVSENVIGSSSPSIDVITPIQEKYALVLGVSPEEITNIELYQFIDNWMGTPYLMGGANEEGIDCSSFTQRLYLNVYSHYIERTAEKQKISKDTDKFTNKEFLREGDLLFFGLIDNRSINHVGIYLGNNKFVNATSTKTNGVSGVKIDDLSEAYWSGKFCCAGRRLNNN